MIYTVTFNPSLDYVVQAKALIPGRINRTIHECIYPGGKGNNVSVVLSNLGRESIALGFVAGFTGESLEKMMKDYGCQTDYIQLKDGFTRINVKVNAGEETEINGQGPVITKEALDELFVKLERLEKGDVLVLAGSIPNTLPDDIYEKILERLSGKGISIVVDATKNLLLNVLKYHPFLIKPNNHELGDLFGVELRTDEEIIDYAKKLQEMGAENVLVSMAGDGAILVTEDGRVYRGTAPEGKVLNSVGAGDSMVAGFLAGYLDSKNQNEINQNEENQDTVNYEKAFQLGIAAGSASAFEYWLAEKEAIESLKENVVVERVLES